jgi:hypothetical protein
MGIVIATTALDGISGLAGTLANFAALTTAFTAIAGVAGVLSVGLNLLSIFGVGGQSTEDAILNAVTDGFRSGQRTINTDSNSTAAGISRTSRVYW